MSFSEKDASSRARFLALMDQIGSVAEVARRLDLNRNTAYGWARQSGLSSQRLGHHRKADYLQLRDQGISQRSAAARVGVHVRTARDWDHGVRKSRNSRFHPDGRRVNYATGNTTMETMTSPLAVSTISIPEQPGARLLSLPERERIAICIEQGCRCGQSVVS